MYHTGAIPQQHISSCYFVDISTKIFIRRKNYLLIFWKTFHNDFCITAGTDHITQCFDAGTAVDIAHHHMIRMLFFEFFEQAAADNYRSANNLLSDQESLLFLKDLRIFAVSAMKCTPAKTIISAFVFSACCAKPKTIADIIRHILDIRFLVVMRQQDRIFFFFQPFNFLETDPALDPVRYRGNLSGQLRFLRVSVYR